MFWGRGASNEGLVCHMGVTARQFRGPALCRRRICVRFPCEEEPASGSNWLVDNRRLFDASRSDR